LRIVHRIPKELIVFQRLGRFVAKRPGLVILAWLAVLVPLIGVGVVYAQLHHWNSSDTRQAGMLSSRYESSRAQHRSDTAFGAPSGNGSAVLVFTRRDGAPLSPRDVTDAAGIAHRLSDQQAAHRRTDHGEDGPPAEVNIDPPNPSANGKVLAATVGFDAPSDEPSVMTAVANLHADTTADLAGSPLQARLTGAAPSTVDNAQASQWVSTAMVAAILILLLVLFRSFVVAFTSLFTIAFVGAGVTGLLTIATHLVGAKLDQTATSLLPVVLFGVGTDYIVFLMFRYRERLRTGDEHRPAMAAGIGKVGEAVVASALAVAVSFSAMLFSQLAPFRVLGPALGLAVLVMLLAALTLVPAVFTVLGRRLSRRRSWRRPARDGVATRVAAAVVRRPGPVVVLTVALLGGLAYFATGYHADYDQSPFQKGSEAATGYADLTSGFPTGMLSPVQILVADDAGTLAPDTLSPYAQRLAHLPGIASGGVARIAPDGHTAEIDLVLTDNPTGSSALRTIRQTVRPMAHAHAPAGTVALVGGTTAAYADIAEAVDRDMKVIFLVAGLAIGLILVLMLRTVASPLYLMGSVVLGFAATLGATVLVFQRAEHLPGVQFQVPLIVYLFVASIGTDYNILMISRVREELRDGATPRQATRAAIGHAGPTVAAAGVVLATSFGVLGFSTITAQIGLPVAIGVLLSTFVMAWLLVPALTVLLGRVAFWPTRQRPVAPVTAGEPVRQPVAV
jgi:RND superfamily putative drug exporter